MSMKKLHYVIISFMLILAAGCSSTNVGDSHSDEKNAPSLAAKESPKEEKHSNELYYKNNQTKEKLLIDDWKYKGFGNELPKWIIPALEDNISDIKKIIPELSLSEIVVLKAEGYNHDQAEKALEVQKKPEGFSKYDSFWVRSCSKSEEKIYISLAVYYR